ncbi:hypothetical protein [Streptomyces sp. NBC_01262]|nr:hypothetical protein [Streptomyces sp. NBC_01262]
MPDFALLLGAACVTVGISALALISRLWPPAQTGTGTHRAARRTPGTGGP